MNNFIEYLNYPRIISIIGEHNESKDKYLYLLSIKNAYDNDNKKIIDYIKIGITNEEPIKKFKDVHKKFYPMGTMKILMLIKIEKPEYIEKIIKKELNTNLKNPINIYSDKIKKSLSTKSYPYRCLEIIKCVINFTLLEYKNLIYSYYFDEECELKSIITPTEKINEFHIIDEDEMVIAYD